MNRQKLLLNLTVVAIVGCVLAYTSKKAYAAKPPPVPTYGYCTDLSLEDIPEGDFSSFAWPQQKPDGTPVFRVTQPYNQPQEEAWQDGNGKWYWGHDGIDVHESPSVGPNINYNTAIQRGVVIAAMKGHKDLYWGYRMTIATRVPHSHQILTFNYAHMAKDSLLFSPCVGVERGERIGLEGDTGWGTGAHLHLTVRIWDNVDELNAAINLDDAAKKDVAGGGGLFQSGYVFNDVTKLANYLSPYHLITDKFLEFECDDASCPLWAKPHALAARRAGIDFGRYDGYFAVDTTGEEPETELLTRGESARWFKVARKYETVPSSSASFTDIPADGIDYPYVSTLVANGVLSPNSDCNPLLTGKQWCPEIPRTRAELVKMIVETFMDSEFTGWQIQALAGQQGSYFAGVVNGSHFGDLYQNGYYHWATTYVLFAAFAGSIPEAIRPVDIAPYFRPEDPVDKLEAVKMLMAAREWYFTKYGENSQYDLCDYQSCAIGETCAVLPDDGSMGPYHAVCLPLPGCVPEEGGRDDCVYGGGYDPCAENPECSAGTVETQTCGYGGTQSRVCAEDCSWGGWSDCSGGGICTPGQTQPCGNCGIMTCGSDYLWGQCQNEGVCSPGQTQSQTCNLSGTQSRTCNNYCQWGGWSACSVNCQCADSSLACCDGCNFVDSSHICGGYEIFRCEGTNPGDDVQRAVVNTYCSGYSSGCNGATVQSPWADYSSCSISQVCEMSGSAGQCVPYETCSDTYLASTSKACYTSAGTQYGYNACLEVQQVSGASWKYRVCRGGGSAFPYGIKYRLYDLNHSSVDLGGPYQEGGGLTCSAWRSFSVGHITQYGSTAGSGLQAEIITPPTCTLNSCKYKTGMITIRKECL